MKTKENYLTYRKTHTLSESAKRFDITQKRAIEIEDNEKIAIKSLANHLAGVLIGEMMENMWRARRITILKS